MNDKKDEKLEAMVVSVLPCTGRMAEFPSIPCGGRIDAYGHAGSPRALGVPEPPEVREALEKIAKDAGWTLVEDGSSRRWLCERCSEVWKRRNRGTG